jgi:hypothetical protein
MRLIRITMLATMLVAVTAGTTLAGGGNSAAAHACQKGGYLALVGSGGETFANTGECVSFAARGGTFATGIIVPAGATVTFDDPTLSACNNLSWGYNVGSGDVELGSKVYGCFTTTQADVTVGPFATATILRVYLTDEFCGPTTYYSDGDHAIVTPTGVSSWQVDIADAGGFCERQNTPVVFTPPGNLSVGVVINP